MLKIIFIGDVVGSLGRAATKKILPKLKRKFKPDLIIANVENLAHGKGVTETTLKEMLDLGIDYFTGGNHIFSKKNYADILNNDNFNIIRPANYPEGAPGVGEKVINISQLRTGASEAGQKNILLVNLMGRVFFKENINCPFRTFDEIVKKYKNKNIDAAIVDFHAEATSEKKAFFWHADGRAQAILGTHTHIPTNDAQISKNGTAYITDAGAVCAKDSVLGVDKDIAVNNFLTQIPAQHELPRTGECEFNAVAVNIDLKTSRAVAIKQISETVKIV